MGAMRIFLSFVYNLASWGHPGPTCHIAAGVHGMGCSPFMNIHTPNLRADGIILGWLLRTHTHITEASLDPRESETDLTSDVFATGCVTVFLKFHGVYRAVSAVFGNDLCRMSGLASLALVVVTNDNSISCALKQSFEWTN